MTDLQILLITIAVACLMRAYLELCDRVRG
jgi:hypothetical protein